MSSTAVEFASGNTCIHPFRAVVYAGVITKSATY